MNNSKNVSKKEKKNFIKNFIVLQLVILYFTLMISDSIISVQNITSDGEGVGMELRYILIVIVTAISVFLIIYNHLKENTREEYENVNKFSKILPILVAVILLCYGFYSVASNIREIEDEIRDNYMFKLYEEYNDDFDIDEFLDEAKSEARITWGITTLIYLAVAEIVAFIAVKKSEANIVEYVQKDNELFENLQSVQEEQVSSNETENIIKEEQPNPIKFDL